MLFWWQIPPWLHITLRCCVLCKRRCSLRQALSIGLRSEELTRWWYWWCHDLCVWETYVGSASLFYSDASGLVARRGQDSWGWIRLQKLPEGDKCAIRPPLELHSGFLLGLLPLLMTQSRGLYRVLSATVSWAQGSRRQGQAQMI